MSLIIATGSNLGDSRQNLILAQLKLCEHFKLILESRVYKSAAVDYTDQPDFFNQVLEFEIPSLSPEEVMSLVLKIELELGRERLIQRGPRTIDIDILFYGLEKRSHSSHLTLPHPRLFERSFVIKPLSELPYFVVLKQHFPFTHQFKIDALPI